MPALSNRQHLITGSSSANGSPSQETALLKKKLNMLERKLGGDTDSNNNNYKSNNQSDDEEKFSDTQTIGVYTKFASESSNEKIPIFGNENCKLQSSFGQSVEDQVAIALLRLQQDLDATSSKLNEIETKVNAISKQNLINQQKLNRQKDGKGIGLFSKDKLYSLAYLTWPVVVFIAMRAIERKSLSAARLA